AELRMEEEWQEQERLRGEEAGERVALRLREIEERERKKLLQATLQEPETLFDVQDTTADTPPPISAGKKRALERSPSTPTLAVSSTTNGPKRLKLSGDAASSVPAAAGYSPSPSPSPQPYQQYPAPLHAYDPRLYPHAASVIAAEDRPRAGEATPPVSDDESHCALAVQPPKKKGGLVRTQTFAQL
ncbi:hypothetical protein C0993_002022, partial [Termitomyces sp. T159_Od127]